jgi:hypothetical protein
MFVLRPAYGARFARRCRGVHSSADYTAVVGATEHRSTRDGVMSRPDKKVAGTKPGHDLISMRSA